MSLRDMSTRNARILIIGAGVAGISAAEHLYSNGFNNIVILEAMNRIGGRVHTSHFGNNGEPIVEQGANWIHGASANNSFFTLATQLKMLPDDLICLDRMSGYCYRSNGTAMDKSLVDKLFKMFTSWEDECPTYTNLKSRPNMSDYLRRRMLENMENFAEEDKDQVQCIFNCLLNYCSFHYGSPLREIPIPDVIGYDDMPGGNVKVPCGMVTILKGLSRRFPTNCIKLEKVVEKVCWEQPEVQVRCEDGSTYLAEHVICSSSLGYLKRHAEDMFEPRVPDAKINAIRTIPFGKVDKLFLQWDHPFWQKGSGSIKLAWTDEESKISSPKEWYKKIFSFDEVLNNSNVLVGWISGDQAEYMESLSEDDVLQTVTVIIRKFLNNPTIPAPTKVLQTKWCQNRYTLGSYSTRNHDVLSSHIGDLIEPLKHADTPRILFSGEATDLLGYSTLHGARNSGLREAERLIGYYGLQNKLCHL